MLAFHIQRIELKIESHPFRLQKGPETAWIGWFNDSPRFSTGMQSYWKRGLREKSRAVIMIRHENFDNAREETALPDLQADLGWESGELRKLFRIGKGNGRCD
jgi:hypothetical protein